MCRCGSRRRPTVTYRHTFVHPSGATIIVDTSAATPCLAREAARRQFARVTVVDRPSDEWRLMAQVVVPKR